MNQHVISGDMLHANITKKKQRNHAQYNVTFSNRSILTGSGQTYSGNANNFVTNINEFVEACKS